MALLGAAPSSPEVRTAVGMACPSVYWRNWRGATHLRMWLYWFVVIPGLTRLFGYLPGERLKLGADIPGAVARQWARWGRSPDPVLGAVEDSLCARLSRYPGRLLALSSPDDDFAPPASVRSLLGCFPRASVAHREVVGARLGLDPIDHLDVFREHVGAEMWPEVTAFLEG